MLATSKCVEQYLLVLPEMQVLIVARRRQVPPVAGPRAVGDALLVPDQRGEALAVRHPPHLERLVRRRRRQAVGFSAHA